jgi:hypothetical protein
LALLVNEIAALNLSFKDFQSEAKIATRPCECLDRRGDVCGCYATLKAARAALARMFNLTDDLEGFEMRVDFLRRHAVAAIRDRRDQGDRAAVEKGCKVFLVICEQGINAAERVGNHAYAAMLQRQRETFCPA